MLLIMAVLTATNADAANRAYRTLEVASIHETESNHLDDILMKTEKGDTVYATAQTEAYILEKDGQQMRYIPVEYKGQKGWISMSTIYPIKLSPDDVLVFDHSASLKDRTAIERYLTPVMEKVMNYPISYMGWIWITIILTAIAGVIMFCGYGLEDTQEQWASRCYCLCAPLLVGISVSEMMYIFSFYEHTLWFAKASVVGGWGPVMLYFTILSIVIASQIGMIYMVWKKTIRANKYDEWVNKLALTPVAIGFIFMIMTWVDYASDTPIEAKTYLMLFWALIGSALIGMFYLFKGKHYLEGIIIPVCFVGAGIGLAVFVMILSMLLVIVAIVGAIGVALISIALAGVCGLLFGKNVKTAVTDDGREIKGWTDANGIFHGDDGNKYTLE